MLLDFQMPKKNGILVMNEVRAYFEEKNRKGFKLKPPYFLFLTAYASPSFKNYLNSLGVNEIFEKPLSETQIRKIINLNKS
jgi:CheY-like chemotaxis protein